MTAEIGRAVSLAAAALSVAAALTVSAQAGEADSARAFLQRVYSHYPIPDARDAYSPLGKEAPEVFDPAMVALFREDRRLAKGDEGGFDMDPFCQCQDDGGMTALVGPVRLISPASAKAVVSVRFPGSASATEVRFILFRVNGAWRVHDIGSAVRPSLRAYFIRENKALARGGG